jgi:hypothetical protein
MLSLLNFLILNTTKTILLESLCKTNFLALTVTEFLSTKSDSRSLKEFELRPLNQSE